MIIDANLEMGPRGFPIISGFRTHFCADPNCGPHLLLLDREDKVVAEFIISAVQLSKVEQETMQYLAGIPKK